MNDDDIELLRLQLEAEKLQNKATSTLKMFDDWREVALRKTMEDHFGGVEYEKVLELVKERYPEKFI